MEPVSKNATLCVVMTQSIEMEKNKSKARAYLDMFRGILLTEYESVKDIYVSYKVGVRVEESEESLFNVSENATSQRRLSVGLKCAIKQLENNDDSDTYVLALTDGNNFSPDDDGAIELIRKLHKEVSLFSFAEINSCVYESNLLVKVKDELGFKYTAKESVPRGIIRKIETSNDVLCAIERDLKDKNNLIGLISPLAEIKKADAEMIKAHPEITSIGRDGNRTTVTINGCITGEAICSEVDTYIPNVGAMIALKRAIIKAEKKELNRIINATKH